MVEDDSPSPVLLEVDPALSPEDDSNPVSPGDVVPGEESSLDPGPEPEVAVWVVTAAVALAVGRPVVAPLALTEDVPNVALDVVPPSSSSEAGTSVRGSKQPVRTMSETQERRIA